MHLKSPFKFLDAYAREDFSFFYGRKDEVEALYKMVFQSDILLVYGASGTGKTSLIQCGLASKFQSHDWLDLYVRRGKNLNDSLEKALQDAGNGLATTSVGSDLSWLDEDLGSNTLASMQQSKLYQYCKAIYYSHFKPIYLIFDQLEELYILGDKSEQQKFIQSISEILHFDQPIKIILSIREEFLGSLYEFERQVPNLMRKKLRVETMPQLQVEEVILKSCRHFNIHFEDELNNPHQIAEALKLKGSISLPYLQVYLDMLWREDMHRTSEEELLSQGLTFTTEEIKQFGEIDDVLRKLLEQRKDTINKELEAELGGLPANFLSDFLDCFVTEEGTKRPVVLDWSLPPEKWKPEIRQLCQMGKQPVEACVEKLMLNRLIRKVDDALELAHDSLAAFIFNLQSEEKKRLNAVRASLENHYQEYLNSGKQILLHPKWLETNGDLLAHIKATKELNEFVEKSLERDKERKQEKLDQEERERKQQQELNDTREEALRIARQNYATEKKAAESHRRQLKVQRYLLLICLVVMVALLYFIQVVKISQYNTMVNTANDHLQDKNFESAISKLEAAKSKDPWFYRDSISADKRIEQATLLSKYHEQIEGLKKNGELVEAHHAYEQAIAACQKMEVEWMAKEHAELKTRIGEKYRLYLHDAEVLSESSDPDFQEAACLEFKKAIEHALSDQERAAVRKAVAASRISCNL